MTDIFFAMGLVATGPFFVRCTLQMLCIFYGSNGHHGATYTLLDRWEPLARTPFF